MPSTNFLFSGLSSCAEYQQVEMMPMASSPICCRQQCFVDRGHSAEDRRLAAILLVLLEELEAVGAGKADEDDVDVLLELRDIGAVIGRDQRRPELLHYFAAGVLEGALEAGVEFVAVGDVVGDHGGALGFEFLGGVVAHGIAALRRGGGRAP